MMCHYNNNVIHNASSETSDVASEIELCRRVEFIWFVLLLGTVCALGYLGNALCLLVLHRSQRHRHSVTYLLLKALACADLLYLLLYGSFKIWMQLIPSELSIRALPYMYAYLWPCVSMLLSISTWLMVLLTVHRYIVVCHPLDAQHRCTLRLAGLQILAVCLVAVIVDIPRFFEVQVIMCSDFPRYNYTWIYSEYYYHLLYKNGLVLTYRKLLPLAITITLTARLVSCLYRARHRRGLMSHVHRIQMTPSPPPPREHRITKALLAVVIVFIVCQMPGAVYPVLNVVLHLRHGERFLERLTRCGTGLFYLQVIADGLTVINSAVNFLIYMLCSAEFRSGFYKLGRRFTWSANSGSSDTNTRPQAL
jgi:hypothetical protein